MQRSARTSRIKKGIEYALRLVALLVLIISAFPTSASCAARADVTVAPAHSCCAPAAAVASCHSAVISNGCCCKAAPLDRAATPGLIAVSSTTPHFVVSALPEIPMPAQYFAQTVLARDNVIGKAPPPKIYIFYRALLI